MMQETLTSCTNSFASNPVSPVTEAPSTLRMPISFVRRSAVYAAKPNKPRQEIKIASIANMPANFPISVSEANNASKSLSANNLVAFLKSMMVK